MQDTITLCLGADEHYFPGLWMATASALQSASTECAYHLLILDGGLCQESLERFHASVQTIAEQRGLRVTSELIPLDLAAFEALPKIWGRSAMTYARILLPELTPAKSVLWVDADMLIFKDLSRFQPTDPATCLLLGVQDSYILTLGRDCPGALEGGLERLANEPYLNCGLLWMNLDRMRAEDYKTAVLQYMQKHKDALAFWDQTALNNTAVGHTECMPATWNLFCLDGTDQDLAARATQDNLHMVSRDKPWLPPMDPDNGPQPARDILFWSLWQHFTGTDSGNQVEASKAQITQADRRRAYWKRLTYGLGRNAYRAAKWKRVQEYQAQLADGSMEREIQKNIQGWLNATNPSDATARARS